MRDICQKLGLCPSTVHDLVARGVFIKPFTLIPGGRAVGWLEVDVDQWIFDRKEASLMEAL
jgi:prophage regulatory protein